MYSKRNFTNYEVHYAKGLLIYAYEFRQWPQNNVTAEVFDYCFNIIFLDLEKIFLRLRIILVVKKLVQFRCVIYIQLFMFIFEKNTMH